VLAIGNIHINPILNECSDYTNDMSARDMIASGWLAVAPWLDIYVLVRSTVFVSSIGLAALLEVCMTPNTTMAMKLMREKASTVHSVQDVVAGGVIVVSAARDGHYSHGLKAGLLVLVVVQLVARRAVGGRSVRALHGVKFLSRQAVSEDGGGVVELGHAGDGQPHGVEVGLGRGEREGAGHK
jgi:hypothetical protein